MPFLRIHSEGVTISWLCVMHTILLENQFTVTKGTQLPRFSAILMLLLRKHGMVLNKNTPCWRKTSIGLLVGQLVVILDLGIGADKAFGHDIFYAHCKACLFAGINISGINGEVMLGQWEFQVGPSVGISAGDKIWVARYTLEVADLVLIFHPKPVKGDWNGVGAHTNYSTKSMREERGYEIIKKAIEKLRKRHAEHITACGEGKEAD